MAGTSEAVKKWVNKIIEENIIAVFAKTVTTLTAIW
ncbi:hypothetical protein PFMALIP_00463 [Plasmodium falciparum MaliPS096_E11]|uniref:Uncharacterized protein n=1 Tax=Plasmodium falciparum MaliPS096_E11 TaxID=1036727 RepID=A0A024WWD5_PLAFA|nr:hypothetical protein PFMALIP_00463 [Plasmodium falciparum MaliPS096_E11]